MSKKKDFDKACFLGKQPSHVLLALVNDLHVVKQ